MELLVLDNDVVFGGFEEMRGDLLRALEDAGACRLHALATNGDGTRSHCSDALGDDCRVTVAHADAVEVDAELIGSDLGKRGDRALAVR